VRERVAATATEIDVLADSVSEVQAGLQHPIALAASHGGPAV